MGAALLAAVALTDTVYGLTVVSDGTSATYRLLIELVGVVLLGVVGSGLPSARLVVLMLTLALVALGTAAYAGLNAV